MFGSTVIDIAIGLVFVYLLLSLICSACNELIERFLRYRAKDLHRGLEELFHDENWVSRLYNHPLVWGLFEGPYTRQAKNLPSYIPATTFALAVMDLVLPGEGTTGATQAAPTAPGVVVNVAAVAPAVSVADPLQPLRDGIQAIPEAHVRQALLALVNAAGKDVAKARENIEGWFNGSMDRVSGWYKRRTQLVILILGFVLAGLLNADSIAIVRVLSTDRTMRESLVAAAEVYAKDPSNAPAPAASAGSGQPATAGSPVRSTPLAAPAAAASPAAARETSPTAVNATSRSATASESPAASPAARSAVGSPLPAGTASPATVGSAPAPMPPTPACEGEKNTPECRIENNLARIRKLGLPIGWTRSPESEADPRSIHISSPAWLVRIVGWLITAFAVSLGASFWFDLLNKFIVVRSTVKPREKSREEGAKD